MPKTANEKIMDAVYLRAVDLSRFELKVQNDLVKILKDIQNNVRKDLVEIKLDPTIPKTLRGKQARLEALNKQIAATINTGTAKMKGKLTKTLRETAVNEGAYSKAMLVNAIPVEIAAAVNTVAISANLLEKIADDTLIDGYTSAEWIGSLGNDLKGRIKRSVREGVVRGEGIGEIVKRITSGDAGFRQFDANLKSIVRSSVSTISNRSAEATYAANTDILKALKWSSTLDARTTDVCRIRDNRLYTVDTHEPIDHSYGWDGGPGSIHWACRSRTAPVLRSAKELGIDTSDATRKAMDGKVPADMNYEQWLRTQPVKIQNKVLGKTKAELWRNGQVKTFRGLTDQTGRMKNLDELPKLKKED